MWRSSNNSLIFVIFVIVGGIVLTPGFIVKAQGSDVASYQLSVGELYKRLEIFPADKVGNAVYKNKVWLYSGATRIIKDAIEIPKLNTQILWVLNDDKSREFDFLTVDKADNFTLAAHNVLTTPFNGRNLVVFANTKGRMQAFLFPFNSISKEFVEDGTGRVAFYHLAKIERSEEIGILTYQLRLHVFFEQSGKVISLPYVLYSRRSKIGLSWRGNQLSVDFGGGKTVNYSVR